MKKLLLILSVILSSCSCLISQPPAQVVYAGQGCEAFLPDYRPLMTFSDNCQIVDTIQTPQPGFQFTASNVITDVTIRAVDISGNWTEVSFTVTMLDTIPPVIGWEGLTAMSFDETVRLYHTWEQTVKVHGIAKWINDQSWTHGMAFADTTAIMKQLHTFTHAIVLTPEEYEQIEPYLNSIY